MADARLLSADEAAARLKVSKATLYAYVSRGRLAAVRDPEDPRARRYSSFEVDQLLRRHEGGRRRDVQTLAALADGWPVLETALAGVVDGRPVYRGQDALRLAQHASVEQVARLLWQFDPHDPFAGPAPQLSAAWRRQARESAGQPLPDRTLALFARALHEINGPAWLPEGAALAAACGAHLRVAVACFLARPPEATPLAQQFRQAWQLKPAADDALRQALVLAAEHEMNLIAFTARGLASVGATLGASLLSGLCHLTSTFDGGATRQVEALWDELSQQRDLAGAVAARLDRGEALPGFNHLSYPGGDPRAQRLLKLAAGFQRLPPIAAQVEKLTGWKPAIDFGLVALRRALGAPREAALALQIAGRCSGIIAHALEQRRSGRRIVARARYLGPGDGETTKMAHSTPEPP